MSGADEIPASIGYVQRERETFDAVIDKLAGLIDRMAPQQARTAEMVTLHATALDDLGGEVARIRREIRELSGDLAALRATVGL